MREDHIDTRTLRICHQNRCGTRESSRARISERNVGTWGKGGRSSKQSSGNHGGNLHGGTLLVMMIATVIGDAILFCDVVFVGSGSFVFRELLDVAPTYDGETDTRFSRSL